MTIREQIIEKLGNYAQEAIVKQHEKNYDHLMVDADGSVWWNESTNYCYYGDRATLGTFGTGSIPCNCDWCSGPDAVDSPSDIDFDGDAVDYCLTEMCAKLDNVAYGYFDDETSEGSDV